MRHAEGSFVLNSFRRPLAVEWKNLQLPMDWNGSRHETDFAVAGLIFQLACDLDGFSIRAQRVAEVGRRRHLQVLANAERALEDRHTLFNGRQIENFGARVDG